MGDVVRTPIGEMWLDEQGILWHRLDSHATVTADAAEEVLRLVDGLTGGESVPAIIDIRGVAYAPPEARSIFAGSPAASHELATALVVAPGASNAMAAVFTSVTKPERPVAVFTSEDEAVAWLQQICREGTA
jgi:hypothetical protein